MRKSTLKKMKAARTAYVENQAKEKLQIDVMQAAMHEAGHALAYQLLLNGVEYADIERKTVLHGDVQAFSTGFTQPNGRRLSRETIENEAICCLAGPAAEGAFCGDEGLSGALGDKNNLRKFARHVGLSNEETVELTVRSYRAACQLIDANMDKVEQIAIELATKGRVDGAQVRAIANASDAQEPHAKS